MSLKELEIGDIFFNVKDSAKHKFIVRGNPVFNIGYGSPTRICMDIKTRELVSKSCRVDVTKTAESKFKEAMKLKPINYI